jgi:hypothetical protein
VEQKKNHTIQAKLRKARRKVIFGCIKRGENLGTVERHGFF